MTRADLITILMNTELEEHRNLTREQARVMVDEIFVAIKEALRNGEVVSLPVGNFKVCEQPRQPLRRWFLKRVRVTYKQRYRIKFKGDKYDLEPTDQPPDILDSKGEMKPSENNSPHKISPAERRKLVAIGIKAGKSQRLIARELNVTATTIARDLEALGITASKKPTATIRKPAVVFKASSPVTPDKKVVSQTLTWPLKPAPRKKGIARRIVLPPKPLSLKPKQPSPAIPLSPEQLRQQRFKEMVKEVESWFDEQYKYYQRATNVVDKARNRLAASPDVYARRSPESPMSAAQLRDHTRPQEMDPVIPQSLSRGEEACALWLALWLAAWEPKDEQLRYKVLDQVRTRLPARLG